MKNLLVVEDDDLFRELLTDALRLNHADHGVHAAESGERAMELLREHRFDLIVTDLCLPAVDGFALLALIRDHHPNTPAIAITGHAAKDLERLARSLGARVFFEKPFDLNVLLFTADRLLLPTPEPRTQGFSLQGLLQALETDGKTSVVSVLSCDARQGRLHFLDGKLVSALTDTHSGEDAVVEILNWPDPEIHVSNHSEPPAPNVRASLASLLRRSSQGRDETLEAALR